MWTVLRIFGLLIVCILQLQAQTIVNPRLDDGLRRGLLFKEEKSFQLSLHTNGYQLGYRKGEIKKYYLTNFYQIEFGNIRHPREFRQSLRSQTLLRSLTNVSGYTYGKQNALMALRAMVGQTHYLGEKAKRRGVAVGVNYQGGVALGMLKPYYLLLKRLDVNNHSAITSKEEKYSEENAAFFLDPTKITGHAGFSTGLNQVKFVPGLTGKGSMHFSWGPEDNYVRVLEAGLQLDLFTKKMPIMVIENNQPYFLNLFLSLQFGKRK